MQDKMLAKKYFLEMVSASIKGLPVPPCPESINSELIYKLSVQNTVQGILYLAVKNGAITLSAETEAKLQKSYMAILAREATQQEEIKYIRSAFSEKNIDFMFLKGTHLKSLYPAPEMRFMVDMDILLHESDLDAARDIMLSHGFTLKMNSTKDIVLLKEPCLTVELHKMLFIEDYFMHDYFSDVWNRAEKCDSNEYKMSLNDLYVYTLAHLAEHYLSAGSCFRPMMDLFLMEKSYNNELDFEYINEQFKTLGIEKFANNIRLLYNCMFADGEYNKDLETMENYIVLGPPVKNAEAAALAATTKKSKIKILFETAFPSFKHMKIRFPILKKLPFLLPLYWAIRIVQYTFTKDARLSKAREGLKNIDDNGTAIMQKIFEKSGF